MKTSVSAFSRLWLGCAKAESLSATDNLSAPEDLINILDTNLNIPLPDSDWDY